MVTLIQIMLMSVIVISGTVVCVWWYNAYSIWHVLCKHMYYIIYGSVM